MSVDRPTPWYRAETGGEEGGDLRRNTADNLPPDLMELAAQLGDDAAFLAARYPAVRFPAVQPGPLRTRDSWLSRCTRRLPPVAAVCLLSVGIGLLTAQRLADAPLATERGIRPVAAGAAAVVPVVSFDLFTGAEQEAVLDLLEEDGLTQESFSI